MWLHTETPFITETPLVDYAQGLGHGWEELAAAMRDGSFSEKKWNKKSETLPHDILEVSHVAIASRMSPSPPLIPPTTSSR